MKRNISLFISFGLLLSCSFSPRPVLEVTPLVESDLWLFGREYVHNSTDSLTTVLAFSGISNNNYIFEFEIENGKTSSFLVDPSLFYYIPRSGKSNINSGKIKAIDPEPQIQEINKIESRITAKNNSRQATNSLFMVLDLFSDISSINDPKSKGEQEEERIEDLERDAQEQDYDKRYKKRTHKLNVLRENWEFHALRKTTLLPGYSYQGLIFFPVTYFDGVIELHFHIDSVEIVQEFKQNQIIVSKYND